MNARVLIRSGLVQFPSLADAKARLQYAAQRLVHRPFEVEFRALESLLSPGDLCLDVGANRGQSIDALKMLSFPVRVTSFEPQLNLYRRLVKRFGEDQNVIVLPFGASDAATVTQIYVPYYNGYCFDGLASVHQEGLDEWLRGGLYRFDERKFEIRAMQCQTVRLDDVVAAPVAFMKLDIQGSEQAALRGAVEILRRDKPHLMIETPSPEVRDFLAALGYTRYVYADGKLQKSLAGTLNPFFLAR